MSKTTRTKKRPIEQYDHIIDAVRKRGIERQKSLFEFIRVHLRLISLTESSRIINAEVL